MTMTVVAPSRAPSKARVCHRCGLDHEEFALDLLTAQGRPYAEQEGLLLVAARLFHRKMPCRFAIRRAVEELRRKVPRGGNGTEPRMDEGTAVQAVSLGLLWAEHARAGGQHEEWHWDCGCALHVESFTDPAKGPHIHPCEAHRSPFERGSIGLSDVLEALRKAVTEWQPIYKDDSNEEYLTFGCSICDEEAKDDIYSITHDSACPAGPAYRILAVMDSEGVNRG